MWIKFCRSYPRFHVVICDKGMNANDNGYCGQNFWPPPNIGHFGPYGRYADFGALHV